MHPGDKHYRNQLVRLTDLTVTSDVIQGVTFENCTLVGPAVILLMGNGVMSDSGFDGDAVGLLWPTHDRDHVIGAIALVDCSVIGCRLQRIGLAYPPDQADKIEAGFNLGS